MGTRLPKRFYGLNLRISSFLLFCLIGIMFTASRIEAGQFEITWPKNGQVVTEDTMVVTIVNSSRNEDFTKWEFFYKNRNIRRDMRIFKHLLIYKIPVIKKRSGTYTLEFVFKHRSSPSKTVVAKTTYIITNSKKIETVNSSNPGKELAKANELRWRLDFTYDKHSDAADSLRLEPERTAIAEIEASQELGAWQLSERLFLTTDNRPRRQPLGRFEFRVTNNFLSLDLGDTYPVYSDLILNGLRVRGGNAQIGPRAVNAHAVYGVIRNEVEIDEANDIKRGVYQRRLWAFKFGNPYLSLVLLKAKDNLGSLPDSLSTEQRPLRASDNLVVGLESKINLFKNRFRFHLSGAFSALTQNADSSLGDSLISKAIDDLIILNATTVPSLNLMRDLFSSLRLRDIIRFPSAAWKLTNSLRLGGHHFRFLYQWIGPGYISLGNPFLQNDRQQYYLQYRFQASRRWYLQMQGEFRENNLLSHFVNGSSREKGFETKILRVQSAYFPALPWIQYMNFRLRVYQRRILDPDVTNTIEYWSPALGGLLKFGEENPARITFRLAFSIPRERVFDKTISGDVQWNQTLSQRLRLKFGGGFSFSELEPFDRSNPLEIEQKRGLYYFNLGTRYQLSHKLTTVLNYRLSLPNRSSGAIDESVDNTQINRLANFKSMKQDLQLLISWNIFKNTYAQLDVSCLSFRDKIENTNNYDAGILRLRFSRGF